MSQGDERGGAEGVPDFFLDEDFVAGARYTEKSAAQRAEEAAAEAREAKVAEAARRKAVQRDRRQEVLARRRPLISFGVLILLGLVVWQLTGSDGGGGPVGPKQIQAYYALPSDAAPQSGAAAAIRREIGVVQDWLKSETDRSLRFVGEGDEVNVSQKRLGVPAARLAERTDASSLVADEFLDADGNPPPADTMLLVFVPVKLEKQVRCGEGSGAGIAIIWLGSCGADLAEPGTRFGEGATLTIAHELVHALGAVRPCAPHYGNNGHVTDDPTDLMYDGGDGSRAVPEDIALDPGRDDYYEAGKKGCDGIEKARLWKK